ncbi:hypothetical protein [Microbacterium sp. SY138]|uniref:hypothetical protein n=1 Tax=Microbacterium sp. SY138 TaxID=3149040 RepID=UPI0032196515
MTSTQVLAIVLYSVGGVFAVVGPLIAAVRIMGKNRDAQSELTGTWIDPANDPDHIRATARADAWWGLTEFGFVGLGVVLASVASIILVVG